MKVNYLTWIKDRLGISTEDIDLPLGVVTTGDLLDWFSTRSDQFKNTFSIRSSIYVSGDGRLLLQDEDIHQFKTLTFFSPIVGG